MRYMRGNRPKNLLQMKDMDVILIYVDTHCLISDSRDNLTAKYLSYN